MQTSPGLTAQNPEIISKAQPITLHHTTPELLKSVINGLKKPALLSWAKACGTYDSSNPTSNKKKLCQLLDDCIKAENTQTRTLLVLLTSKLDDYTIKLELLANRKSLSSSASQRKKDLIDIFNTDADKEGSKRIEFIDRNDLKLYEGSPLSELASSQPPPQVTSNSENSTVKPSLSSAKPKKSKKKKKKRRGSNSAHDVTAHNEPEADGAETDVDTIASPKKQVQSGSKVPVDAELVADDLDHNKNLPSTTGCNSCAELKLSLAVLQESIISLKDEMLEQRSISELILSSPTTSDKKLTSLLRSKVAPIEDKLSGLRADLNQLRATIDEQNKALELLSNMKNTVLEELKDEQTARLENVLSPNPSLMTRLIDLEINNENIRTAIRNVARSAENDTQSLIEELRHSVNTSIETLKTTSSSNINRITALETSHEELTQSLTAGSLTNRKTDEPTQRQSNAEKVKKPTLPPRATETVNTSGTRPQDQDRVADSDEHSRGSQRIENTSGASQRVGDQAHTASDENRDRLYKRHTVLLIHDDCFKEFNSERFNRQFHVHNFKVCSFDELQKQSKKLNQAVTRLRPDCIYIHTGANDFIKKKAGVMGHVKELAQHLMKTTKAQICFSSLIPTTNNSSHNNKIKLVNEEISDYVSWLRSSNSEAKDRIFTFTNDKIGDHNSYSPTTGFKLSDKGQKMLWIRLREGLKKTLRLPRISYHGNNSSRSYSNRRSTNRFSNE